jgi:hypothetical protein
MRLAIVLIEAFAENQPGNADAASYRASRRIGWPTDPILRPGSRADYSAESVSDRFALRGG